MVDRPARPLQGLGHAAVAITGEREHELLDRCPQRHSPLSGPLALRCVVPTAADAEDGTEVPYRDHRAQLLDEGVLDAERDCARCQALFKTMFSTVSWPTMRSNSAILSSAAVVVLPGAAVHAATPCWAYCSRHLRSVEKSMPCSRQICPGRLAPASNSSTTVCLNCGLYRCVPMSSVPLLYPQPSRCCEDQQRSGERGSLQGRRSTAQGG